jgi:hypothetical protein
MDGTVIDNVKYKDGHSDIGKTSLLVQLIAFPTNLTVKVLGGKPLFSVPWENFGSADTSVVYKEGLDFWLATLFRTIPGLDLTSGSSAFTHGVRLRYWDNDIERGQEIFFDTGSESKADRVVRKILQYRDQYFRQKKNISAPQHRQAE